MRAVHDRKSKSGKHPTLNVQAVIMINLILIPVVILISLIRYFNNCISSSITKPSLVGYFLPLENFTTLIEPAHLCGRFPVERSLREVSCFRILSEVKLTHASCGLLHSEKPVRTLYTLSLKPWALGQKTQSSFGVDSLGFWWLRVRA